MARKSFSFKKNCLKASLAIMFAVLTFGVFAPIAFGVALSTSVPVAQSEFKSADFDFYSYSIQGAEGRPQSSLANILGEKAAVTTQTLGPSGQSQFLSIRGASSAHTLVMLDGFEINDPSAPNNIGDLAWLGPLGLDSATVRMGPQSGRFGSSALGGVLEIESRDKVSAKFNNELSLRAGSYGTREIGAFGLAGRSSEQVLSINFFQSESEGFSVSSDPGSNLEKDGHLKQNLFVKSKNRLSPKLRMKSVFLGGRSDVDLDQGSGKSGDDPNFKSIQEIGIVGTSLLLNEGTNQHTLSIQGSLFEREYFDKVDLNRSYSSAGKYEGERGLATYSVARVVGSQRIAGGIGVQSDGFRSNNFVNKKYDGSRFAFVETTSQLLNWFGLEASYRSDYRDSESALNNSHRLACSFLVSPKLVFHLANASGFKYPSMSQLFDSTYGNPKLLSETVMANELGVSYNNSIAKWGINFSQQNFENLIIWDFARQKPLNVLRTKIEDVGLFIATDQTRKNSAELSIDTLIKKENLITKEEIPNRPDWKMSVSYSHRPDEDMVFRFSQIAIGSYVESLEGGRVRKNSGHSITNFGAGFSIQNEMTLSFSVENVFDAIYFESEGYSTSRRSYFASLKAAF